MHYCKRCFFDIILVLFLTGCHFSQKKSSNSSCSNLVFVDSKKDLHGINSYIFFSTIASELNLPEQESFDKEWILDSITDSLKNLGCSVSSITMNALAQSKMDGCNHGMLYLYVGNVLTHYLATDETGASGGFIPIIHAKMGVDIAVQVLHNKKNVTATLWQRELFFQQSTDPIQLHQMTSERIEKLFKEFVERYQEANPRMYPKIYILTSKGDMSFSESTTQSTLK